MKKPYKPTMKLAILAQCHQCCGYYGDTGNRDCENTGCSLYPFMPYRKKDPDLEWMEYNPKKKGKVKWEDCGRELTDEQRERLQENIKKAHEARRNKEK